jgi:AmiR/NasT family two-component response regulator
VSVPLQGKEDKVIGVLNCFTGKPHVFSETDINMLTAVANQAAVAIHNTDLIIKTRVIERELQTRKQIERAKEILMQRRDLNGEEAYRWIQKRSMDTRKSMLEIAEALILSDEL